MFDHVKFDHYSFENIPLACDLFLMDEKFMIEYEDMMLSCFNGAEYQNVGYISYIAARKIKDNSLELSLYPNVFDRFHEVIISLPKDQFVACIGCWDFSEKPRIFAKSAWIENIYLRSYSIFALIDADGVKKALESGDINRDKLIALRDQIDLLSQEYPSILFISFADSLLLKSNWRIEYDSHAINKSYHPETFIYLANKINDIYNKLLGLKTYAVIAQGSNEFYKDPLHHISITGNHISLNSLGLPFSQLQSIETAARKAIKDKLHGPSELYMDELYYHSLKFNHSFEKRKKPTNTYQTKMMETTCKYYYMSIKDVMDNLERSKN